jgi:hypothetical protein
MQTPDSREPAVNTENYTVLHQTPPYIDLILQHVGFDELDFQKVKERAQSYENDPRLIDMVRESGDGSGKVPYLLDENAEPGKILFKLRSIAGPHVEHLYQVPTDMRMVINHLLAFNEAPAGSDELIIPALLEIDRMQGAMTTDLRAEMQSHPHALRFYEANAAALKKFDDEWSDVRKRTVGVSLFMRNVEAPPIKSTMSYIPKYSDKGRLTNIFEERVIIRSPFTQELQRLTPGELKRPRPEGMHYPAFGSQDFLLLETGKIGRHSIRAMLDVIKDHMKKDSVKLAEENYSKIAQLGTEALREYYENHG